MEIYLIIRAECNDKESDNTSRQDVITGYFINSFKTKDRKNPKICQQQNKSACNYLLSTKWIRVPVELTLFDSLQFTFTVVVWKNESFSTDY